MTITELRELLAKHPAADGDVLIWTPDGCYRGVRGDIDDDCDLVLTATPTTEGLPA